MTKSQKRAVACVIHRVANAEFHAAPLQYHREDGRRQGLDSAGMMQCSHTWETEVTRRGLSELLRGPAHRGGQHEFTRRLQRRRHQIKPLATETEQQNSQIGAKDDNKFFVHLYRVPSAELCFWVNHHRIRKYPTAVTMCYCVICSGNRLTWLEVWGRECSQTMAGWLCAALPVPHRGWLRPHSAD